MKNLRNDPLWDELLYQLKHQETDEEKRLRILQENAACERILDKKFGKSQKGTMTGGVAPVDYTKSYDQIQNNQSLSKEEKAAQIKSITEARKKEIERQHNLKMAQYIGGAALEIGSMFVPGLAGAKLTNTALKMSKPLLGQVFKNQAIKGAVEGGLSGVVSGAGRGLIEDKNVLSTAGQDALAGIAVGSALGVAPVIKNLPRIKKLDETLDKRKDWGIAYQKQSGKPAEAIDKLIEEQQGFVPNAFYKEGIGDVDLVWGKQNLQTGEGYGLEHIIDGRNRKNKIDGVEFVKKLPETIEKGVVTTDVLRPRNLYIEDYDNKIGIPTKWNNKPRNWVLTAHPQNKSASKRLAAYTPQLSKPRSGSRSNFTAELTADNNIIPESSKNLNSWRGWLEHLRKNRGF